MTKKIKKIITMLILFLSFFSLNTYFWNAECVFKDGEEFSLIENLKDCKPKSLAWEDWVEYTIEWWFKEKAGDVITLIMSLLWIWAVWAIVFWGFMMVISFWDEAKFDKAKEIIKWWIFGFLWMISAWWLIAIIVNIIYFLID